MNMSVDQETADLIYSQAVDYAKSEMTDTSEGAKLVRAFTAGYLACMENLSTQVAETVIREMDKE